MTYPALAARLRALPPSCGPVRIVAVDGPSGAGKSTFTAHLAEVLPGAPVVRSDDFRVPWDADPLTWWRPLRDRVLGPLREGRPALLRRYDWHRDRYGPEEEIRVAPVLVVEGVGAAWAESPAAYRIWIDAPTTCAAPAPSTATAPSTPMIGTRGPSASDPTSPPTPLAPAATSSWTAPPSPGTASKPMRRA